MLKLPLAEGFSIDLEKLENSLQPRDLLILGNPNNPTGLRIPEPVLKAVYDLVISRGAFLLLDEAFLNSVQRIMIVLVCLKYSLMYA